MDSSKELKDRERIAKQIAKTSDSIRKKYRALKTGKIDEDIALEKHFKPVVEPLKQIVENTAAGEESQPIKKEVNSTKYKNTKKRKFEEEDDDDDDNYWMDNAWLQLTPSKQRTKESNVTSDSFNSTSLEPRKLSYERSHVPAVEDVYETPNEPLETLVKQSLQTRQFREELNNQLGPLGQKYVNMLLSGDREKAIDHVYGVYLNENGTMLGDKRFDVDTNDFVIIDGVKYKGTPGLYELIFKRIPDDAIYTENDKLAYKSILLATNAHRRSHNADNPILGNKGYKYKNIIAPIVSSKIQVGTGIPLAMTLNDGSGKRIGGKSVIPLAMTLNDNKIMFIGTILTSSWIAFDCSRLHVKRVTTLTITKFYPLSRDFVKLGLL
ncbi:hypothetical protein ALC62_02234 [Cyphomyrmex costatus]|uniref:DUF8207 domain-containing protein n=1 Tax=Cyphomyrmex costatus TaxID=456900 RepID=A0A195D1Y0_9HYME|nr:hypothetical protein ALC62_02234 [Cyphomyrmex costatus]